MTRTRSPIKYIIEEFKKEGADKIVPSGALRFVHAHLGALPESWSRLNREALLRCIREACERGAAIGLLRRKRMKDTKGYVYFIVE